MEWSTRHKPLLVTAAVVAGVLLALILGASLLNWKRPVERIASARMGRAVTIDNLRVHLWSRTPSFTAAGLHVAGPAWDPQRPTAEIRQGLVELELSQLLRGHLVFHRVELDHPNIYLHREKSGRASWTFENTAPSDAKASKPAKWPAVRDLLISSGTLELEDEIRHLKLKGTVEAREADPGASTKPFQVRTKGTINGEPFKCYIEGGPLILLTPEKPYPFTLGIEAGTNKIGASGEVLKPFDLAQLDLKVNARGRDLAELYYLTQLALPNSPPYNLQAHIQRDGTKVSISEISGQYGRSDMRGALTVDASRKRPFVTGQLESKHLFFSDFAAATGRESTGEASLDAKTPAKSKQPASKSPVAGEGVFPTASLQVDRLRAMDADVHFHATSIEAGKFPFTAVGLRVQLKNGELTVDPVKFELPQGQVSAALKIDARTKDPRVHVDARMTDIQLAQIKGKGNGPPPLQGTMQARAVIDGTGDSVHALMAGADGNLTLVLPQGEIRAALPELTGIDIPEGVVLLLGKSAQAQVRCGVVHFDVQDGLANADNVVIDTQNVLITGGGQINLDSEALDLAIQGHPKKVRLIRVRSPVEVRGTLARPALRLDAGSVAKQGGAAVALGALLTPVAALLAFVDPGLAKDQNCAQLLQSAGNVPERTQVVTSAAR